MSNNSTPVYKKWWFWLIMVILAIIVAVIIFFVSGFATIFGGMKAVQNAGENITESINEATSSEITADTSKTYSVGETITNNGTAITVNGITRNYDTGNPYMTPEAGKEYIEVNVTINNQSDEKISYNTYDWQIQDASGDIQNVASIQYSTDGAMNSGELAPGGTKTATLYFEVPANDTGLILQYKPSFLSSETIDIKL